MSGSLVEEYYTYNAVGSVVANTDQDGYVIRENDFDAYGNIVREEDLTTNNFPIEFGGSQNDLLFSTKERDFSTGLDYFGFRYYDAVLGKFITRDPSGYPDGPNNYLYVNNNPINSIDPLGLKTLQEVAEDGQMDSREMKELELTYEEAKEIIKTMKGKTKFFTKDNLGKRKGDALIWYQEKFGVDSIPLDSLYAVYGLYAKQLNQENASRIVWLRLKAPHLRKYTNELYYLARSMNAVHYVGETGYAIGSGQEPVTGENVNRWQKTKELALYFVLLKGTSAGLGHLKNKAKAPLSNNTLSSQFRLRKNHLGNSDGLALKNGDAKFTLKNLEDGNYIGVIYKNGEIGVVKAVPTGHQGNKGTHNGHYRHKNLVPEDGEILVGFEAHLKGGKLSISDRSGHFNSGTQSLSGQETKNFINVMKNIGKSSGYKDVNIKTGGKTVHQE